MKIHATSSSSWTLAALFGAGAAIGCSYCVPALVALAAWRAASLAAGQAPGNRPAARCGRARTAA